MISQVSMAYVHKVWNLKHDAIEMTAATTEDCIAWLLENCRWGRNKTFEWANNLNSEWFKSINGDFSDVGNE